MPKKAESKKLLYFSLAAIAVILVLVIFFKGEDVSQAVANAVPQLQWNK
ncbi:MAG: hypothetical protein AB1626_00935 [Candidatus Micrarchaeota archaeon]